MTTKLIKDIDKRIANWNERSSFTLKGVKNLSRADLETLRLYAQTISRAGTWRGQLMRPVGYVSDVLQAYELEVN